MIYIFGAIYPTKLLYTNCWIGCARPANSFSQISPRGFFLSFCESICIHIVSFHLTSPNPTVKLIYRVKLFVVRPRKEKKRRVEELYGDKHTCSFELRKFGGPIFALPYSFFCMGYIFRVCCLSSSLSLSVQSLCLLTYLYRNGESS